MGERSVYFKRKGDRLYAGFEPLLPTKFKVK
jgi:hypothetical protein